MYVDAIEYVRNTLSKEEQLAQLAEECAELGKAALKLRRVYDGRNPTPVTRPEAFNNLVEEIAMNVMCDLSSALILIPSESQIIVMSSTILDMLSNADFIIP